jgi:hypothetical protein
MPGITRVGLILCATLLAWPAGAAAQGIATSLHELRLLVRPGETVTVVDTSGREVKGRIESLSAAQIVLRTPDGPRQWSDPDLRVIRQRRGDSLGNGALIGFGIGAGIGIAGGLALRESGETGAVVAAFGALYGGIGAGIGVGFDALITRTYVIYDPVGAPRPQVRVLPLVAPTRQGLVVSVSF